MADWVTYKNYSRNSSVYKYRLYDRAIRIQFRYTTRNKYVYNYTTTGSSRIEKMKSLAKSGRGLNSYINRYNPRYYRRY